MAGEEVWVTWSAKGRDPLSNPKAKTAHLAAGVRADDVAVGSFPLVCGRWAPDGFDAAITPTSSTRRCRRCLAKEGRWKAGDRAQYGNKVYDVRSVIRRPGKPVSLVLVGEGNEWLDIRADACKPVKEA